MSMLHSDIRRLSLDPLIIVLEKSGCTPSEAPQLAVQIRDQCPLLKIIGLMTIGKYDNYDKVEGINPDFKALRDCRTPVAQALAVPADQIELSMGMSGDFEHAVSLNLISSFLACGRKYLSSIPTVLLLFTLGLESTTCSLLCFISNYVTLVLEN